jgi:predicted HicB family RNase H-like nuclease
MMEYKGYYAKVEFDEESNIFHGEVINISDIVTFEGTSVDELKEAFQDSIDDYLDFCAERGEDPAKPYSGRFVIRTNPELHKSIAIEAKIEGKSLNALVNEILSKSVKSKDDNCAVGFAARGGISEKDLQCIEKLINENEQ